MDKRETIAGPARSTTAKKNVWRGRRLGMQGNRVQEQMDNAFVNPFVEGVCDFFAMMLDSEIHHDSVPSQQACHESQNGVVASIEMNGWLCAVVELHLPDDTAVALVNRLTGFESKEVDASVLDGVAESVNIIAGGAKAKLSRENRPPIDLGLPTVYHGNTGSVSRTSKTERLEIYFTSDLGPLLLRVNYEPTS